jgi:ABC-type transport system involved in multi-copper enzyme maturation permease subunit
MLVAFLALPFSAGSPALTPSVEFASSTAQGLLLFLLGIIVFYAGEAIHRDREGKVEPILWSMPVRNSVLLVSKFLATFVLACALLPLIGLTAILTQLVRGQTPIEVSTYLFTYLVILVPSLAFMSAGCVALNVIIREKYFAYAIIIAVSSGLFYLYTQGYNHWLYNPVLYGLWNEADLVAPFSRLLPLRAYCFGLTLLFLLAAHLGFERRTNGSRRVRNS